MIEQTVNAILEAEKKASKMEEQALNDAKTMVANADEEAEIIRQKAIKKVKNDRKKVVDEANAEGDKQAKHILALGNKQATKLNETIDISKAVDFIKEKVLSKYVNS